MCGFLICALNAFVLRNFRQIVGEERAEEDDDDEEDEHDDDEEGEQDYGDVGRGRGRRARNIPGMVICVDESGDEGGYDGEDDESFFRDGVDFTSGGSGGGSADSQDERRGGRGFVYPGGGVRVGGEAGGGGGSGAYRGDAGGDSIV